MKMIYFKNIVILSDDLRIWHFSLSAKMLLNGMDTLAAQSFEVQNCDGHEIKFWRQLSALLNESGNSTSIATTKKER